MEAPTQSTQATLALLLFSFTTLFLLSSLILKLLSVSCRKYCNCEICKAYLTGSWSARFPNLCDWYTHLLRTAPTGTIHIHVLNNVVTANPTNVEYMLKTHFHNFPKGKRFSDILGDFLGNGIFTADGSAWLKQRKAASLALGGSSVRDHAFQMVSEQIKTRLMPLLASADDSVDLQEIFRMFALEMICKISFGLDPESLELSMPVSDYVAAFDMASHLSAMRAVTVIPAVWKLKRFLNIGSERELRRAVETVNELALAVISKRRELGQAGSHDLLSRFMGSVECDGQNNKYLRDVVIAFLLAGCDTVASGLTAFFLLLSKNPSALTAMREEIDSITRHNTDDYLPSHDEQKSMHRVHAALHESMRLFPPVQFDSKFCAQDDTLPDGTYVTKGTRVTYHPYAMARMESVWGRDCEEFKPERWINKEGVFVSENPFKYPVFQAGLRVCLGKDLALTEMKTVIVSMIRAFDIEVLLEGGDFPRFAPGLTASFKGGLPARVQQR